MRLIIAIDHRFQQTPDKAMWTMTSFTYPFWQRYLSVFDHVCVLARVQQVTEVKPSWTRCDGEGVSFTAVPYYVGPVQYIQRIQQVTRAIRKAVEVEDAVLLRINGQIASSLEPELRRTGHPYAVEVVGDPYDAFAPGFVTHPLRPFLRWWFPRRMRRQCAGACAAAYVTEFALQRRYPPAPDAFATHYSSIVLHEEDYAVTPRSPQPGQSTFNLIIVGTLDNLSKGPDTLIDALAICIKEGLDLHLSVVGGGKYQESLESQTMNQGLNGRIHFLGWLPSGAAIRNQLDQANLFILPSRQEGLSRATIEAMARALPCIATTVGGTSELLPDEDLVPCNEVSLLAQKIHEVVTNPKRMASMSNRNLEKAKDYREENLSMRWSAMYRHLRERTEAWIKTRQ